MLRGKLDTSRIVPVVGDGGIAHPGIGDGRLIPVLIVDCAKHPDLYELIRLHETTPPGDAHSTWGREYFDKKNVYLAFEFERPVATTAVFRFSLDKQSGIVDGIIHARGVYLQPLQSGSRVFDGMNSPKILVEVPASATFDEWPALHRATVVRKYRADGAPKAVAKALAEAHLQRLSELWSGRQRSGGGQSAET
jgi:hypothetical protein